MPANTIETETSRLFYKGDAVYFAGDDLTLKGTVEEHGDRVHPLVRVWRTPEHDPRNDGCYSVASFKPHELFLGHEVHRILADQDGVHRVLGNQAGVLGDGRHEVDDILRDRAASASVARLLNAKLLADSDNGISLSYLQARADDLGYESYRAREALGWVAARTNTDTTTTIVEGEHTSHGPGHHIHAELQDIPGLPDEQYLTLLSGQGPRLYSLLGRGAEHLVFEPVPPPVVKLSTFFLEKHNKPGLSPEEAKQALEKDLESRQERLNTLERHFGSQAVPQELDIYPWQFGEPRNTPMTAVEKSKFYTIRTKQDRVTELDDPGSFISMTAPNPERQAALTYESFAELNRRWTSPEVYAPPTAQDIDSFLELQGTHLQRIMDEIPYNSAATESVRSYVSNCIRYSQETGETLDLAGENNVIVTKAGEVKLIDALVVVDIPFFRIIPQAVDKVREKESLEALDAAALFNGLNYIRLTNFLAAISSHPQRLVVTPSSITTEQWSRALDATQRLALSPR